MASPEKSQTIPQYDGPAADRGASPTSPRSPRSPTRVQSPTAGDPALDRPKRFTDICRNVDLAAVMYSLDGLVSADIFIISTRLFTYNGTFHWTRPHSFGIVLHLSYCRMRRLAYQYPLSPLFPYFSPLSIPYRREFPSHFTCSHSPISPCRQPSSHRRRYSPLSCHLRLVRRPGCSRFPRRIPYLHSKH